jgi:tetratricopeptide (TPR) repeat protein
MPHRMTHWAIGVACALLIASGVRAQERSEPPEYREVVRCALQQFDQGRYAEAGALFERAHQLFPNARTLWGLGLVAFEDRDYVGAVMHLEASLTDARRPLAAAQRTQAEKALKESWEFVAGYQLHLEPSTANLRVDGNPAQMARDLLLMNPGSHELVVDAPQYRQVTRRIEARSGERSDLSVELELETEPGQAATEARHAPLELEARPTAPAPARSGPPMWLAYTLVGTGGALLAGALVTGLISNHDFNELDRKCGAANVCPNGYDWQSARDEGKNMALAANLLALSGVLTAGTGAVLWYVWADRDENAPQAALACVPGACVTRVRLAF